MTYMREIIENLKLDSKDRELIISELEKKEGKWAEIEEADRLLKEKVEQLENENALAKEKETELLGRISEMKKKQLVSELRGSGLILGLEEFASEKIMALNENGEPTTVEDFKNRNPGFFTSEKKENGDPLPQFSSKIGNVGEESLSDQYRLNFIRRP